jgi:hypothetical protein
MKKQLLILGMILGTTFGFSQTCSFVTQDLEDYLTATSKAWGTMPDTIDNLPLGAMNQQYDETIAIRWAATANQLDPSSPALTVNWVEIASISGLPTGITWVGPSSTADSIICGGSGADAANCKWAGGAYACIRINGTPTQMGTFPLTIGLNVRVGNLTTQSGNFTGFKLVVGTAGVELINDNPFKVMQNVPNPFSQNTTIKYSVEKSTTAKFYVMNLLGELVYSNAMQANVGQNTINFDGSDLNEGIYMYTLEIDGKKVTKRMVINK